MKLRTLNINHKFKSVFITRKAYVADKESIIIVSIE